VNLGHSVLLIEHNVDIMMASDWIIDLGPEGGFGGGKVIATGTPEEVMELEQSHTGRYLKRHVETLSWNR
jgi:excinuclease ABC subunit A